MDMKKTHLQVSVLNIHPQLLHDLRATEAISADDSSELLGEILLGLETPGPAASALLHSPPRLLLLLRRLVRTAVFDKEARGGAVLQRFQDLRLVAAVAEVKIVR